jgi:SAM-dependent methyltransferase
MDVPTGAKRVVDLGAGTGGLSRLLLGRVDQVIAVEPDDRMRAVLVEELPAVDARAGRGDAMPVEDGSVDAVIASSSWHWMDVVPTLHEMARILVPGGTLGAVWSGPDPDGPIVAQAREMLGAGSAGSGRPGDGFDEFISTDAGRPFSTLEIPAGLPFGEPEQETFIWNVALTADELIGLLGTFSWMLLMDDDRRAGILTQARQLLKDVMGVEGDATIDMQFRANAYRNHPRRAFSGPVRTAPRNSSRVMRHSVAGRIDRCAGLLRSPPPAHRVLDVGRGGPDRRRGGQGGP